VNNPEVIDRMRDERGLAPKLAMGSLLGLAGVLIAFTTVRILQSGGSVMAQPVGLAISGVLSVTLFGGVLVVHRYDLGQQAARITGWTYLGAIAVTVAVVANILTLELVQPEFRMALYMVTTSVAAGAVLGFVIGLYDAHQTRYQRELTEKRTEAQTLSNRLSVLNRVLRHDIRTQAQLLQGASERLVDGDLAPAVAAEQIQGTVDRLTTLSDQARQLQDLLDDDALEAETLDIVAALAEAKQRVQDDHPRLAVDADLPENRLVEASPMITIAFEQVLQNVAEHVDDPEPRARISLTDADDRSVRLSIADNGPGIDEPEMVHNTNETVSQLRHSRGLGLWLVTWILEKSNGELRIETPAAEDTGTNVMITVPAPSEAD
jgi:signal transduction histidine kinase